MSIEEGIASSTNDLTDGTYPLLFPEIWEYSISETELYDGSTLAVGI
jgi:hypothetical protein